MRVNFCIFGNQVFNTLSNRPPLEPSRDCSAAAVAKSAEPFKQMFSFFMSKLHEIVSSAESFKKRNAEIVGSNPRVLLTLRLLKIIYNLIND